MHVMMTTDMSATANNDADLVVASLAGDRDAFGKIVSRYQSLICSLAYSATGSLGASEDLAQETFITAWKHLPHLREQHKLRAWLCGIARNRINSTLRREGREPVRDAETLDVVHESASAEPLPHDHTISKEEEAILWRSLERIPEIYREPLVLFYREHQSIEAVASALELSEDAVKQRLSRGRKLLAEEVSAFVESVLVRTNPGKVFTLGVLAAIPVTMATSAKAAVLGAAAVKGGAAANVAGGLGLSSMLFGSLLSLAGPWIQYRMMLDAARTDAERTGVKRYFRQLTHLVLAFATCVVLLMLGGGILIASAPTWFGLNVMVLMGIFLVVGVRFALKTRRLFAEFQTQRAALGYDLSASTAWEYRSPLDLLGLPLVHIRLVSSAGPGGRPAPVKAWFAAGDTAFGLLFAFGGIAVAPVSVGGLAVGLISWGGLALGLFAAGGLAFGGWAFGGLAIGWQSFGGCALGWNAALGGLAVARDYALGGIAYAIQANNELASQFIKGNSFFRNMESLSRHLAWLSLLWLIPLFVWWHKVAQRRARLVS